MTKVKSKIAVKNAECIAELDKAIATIDENINLLNGYIESYYDEFCDKYFENKFDETKTIYMQILSTTKKRDDLQRTKGTFMQKKIDVQISSTGHRLMDVKQHIVDRMGKVQNDYDKYKNMQINDDFSKLSESMAMYNNRVF